MINKYKSKSLVRKNEDFASLCEKVKETKSYQNMKILQW